MADDLNLLHGTVTDGGGSRTFSNPGNANDGVDSSIATMSPYVSGSDETAYLETDLGSAFAVAEHIVWGDHECGSSALMDDQWAIQGSTDGSSWDDIAYSASETGTPGADDYRVRFVFDTVETYRYWRFVYQLTPAIGFQCGAQIATWEIFGEVAPTEPPVDPGHDIPEPGHAILEIYVHDEDASRWDVATWATGPATGTEGIWSGAGWQDVTPEGVSAHVIYGARRPERGILATQDAASWLVVTYDPDRVLDPGNPDSPYAPQLVSGVPIRISHSTSGTIGRTGIIDRIEYAYKAPDYRGQIVATSTIAIAHRAEVPADSSLGDTLRERIRDAAIASGIAIGGIPLLGTDDSYPDIPLSARIDGAASLWDHVRAAGEEALWVIYEDNHGTLQSRPWGGPLDRGREITYASLEDLKVVSSPDGIYSVVRVNNVDGSAIIERESAPLPRYGRIVYERDEKTINPEAWADAVLADRAWPGVQWIPGTIWAFDAADVEYFLTLELMERVHIVVPGVVDVAGRILGGEMWVEARTETRSRWLFLLYLATEGSTAIGTTTLVADFTGDVLIDDATGTNYLEAD